MRRGSSFVPFLLGAAFLHACVLREPGAGSSWEEVASPTIQELRAISGVSPTDIWAVGTEGIALHFDGTSWHSVPSGTDDLLQTVQAFSPSDVWAGGIGGVRRWD